MGFRRRFAIGLLWRAALLLLAAGALGWLLWRGGYVAPVLVAVAALAIAARALWAYLAMAHSTLARFVDAVAYADFGQRFDLPGGGGLEELGDALNRAILKLRAERAAAGDEGRLRNALVEAAPVALLIVGPDGRVERANAAARRLFGASGGPVRAVEFADHYGPAFAAMLTAEPGARQTVALTIDGAPQRALVVASRLARPQGALTLLSVQPIGGELGQAELAAETGLIRVLTHEVMNSLTPVTSLARTAAGLLVGLGEGGAALADARASVDTLARRADGLMRFVESYRRISRAPPLERRRFAAAPWAEELVRLIRADWPPDRLKLDVAVADGLLLDADPDLLAQVVLNLLRNAAEATAGSPGSHGCAAFRVVELGGGRTGIEVEDNGPGIPPERRTDVFLPFYTTKTRGTGVGLSFARQIVLAHGGSIAIEMGARGGALLRLVI